MTTLMLHSPLLQINPCVISERVITLAQFYDLLVITLLRRHKNEEEKNLRECGSFLSYLIILLKHPQQHNANSLLFPL